MKFLKYSLPAFVFIGFIAFLMERKNSSLSPPKWMNSANSQKGGAKKETPLLSKMVNETTLGSTPFDEKTIEQIPDPCVTQWKQITQMNVQSYLKNYQDGRVHLNSSCASAEKDIGFAAEMYDRCALSSGHLQDEKTCIVDLKLYRAFLIDKLTLNETDYSRIPISVLITKFIGRMSVKGESEMDELRKMAEQIKYDLPDNPSTYKILASLEMIAEKPNLQVGTKEAETGLEISPGDLELQSAWFYFKAKDPNFHYMDFVEKNPQYPYGQYFKAGLLWNEGQQQDSLSILQSLVKKYPQVDHFKETLAKAQKNSDRPFRAQFDISKDNW